MGLKKKNKSSNDIQIHRFSLRKITLHITNVKQAITRSDMRIADNGSGNKWGFQRSKKQNQKQCFIECDTVVEVSRIASDQQRQESVQKSKRSQKISVESQEMVGNVPIFNKYFKSC